MVEQNIFQKFYLFVSCNLYIILHNLYIILQYSNLYYYICGKKLFDEMGLPGNVEN